MEKKQKKIEDLTIPELKALAFDIDQQIKQNQRDYNVILQLLQNKTKEQIKEPIKVPNNEVK